jgi:hypothetical protein
MFQNTFERQNMKKTILCLIIISVVGTCVVTNAMAAPEITGVRGGYGVIATVVDANGLDWQIELGGPHIFQGSKTEGAISGNSTTIRTPILPPALGFGKINITVTILWSFIPVAIEDRTAVMLGPFVLFVQ